MKASGSSIVDGLQASGLVQPLDVANHAFSHARVLRRAEFSVANGTAIDDPPRLRPARRAIGKAFGIGMFHASPLLGDQLCSERPPSSDLVRMSVYRNCGPAPNLGPCAKRTFEHGLFGLRWPSASSRRGHMGSFVAVLYRPFFDALPGIGHRDEPGSVQARGMNPPVEHLDEPVVCWLSGH